jgi:hypothetical protein
MKLSEIKTVLKKSTAIAFQLPQGELIAPHFHVTEVGKITKHFIDCGGTVRTEEVANFQLWEANDYNHRLHPEKLLNIIELSEKKLEIPDLEIEVEYQTKDSIGKFGLEFDGTHFQLTSKLTNCLAIDKCGIPESQIPESQIPQKVGQWKTKATACCTPESDCC